MSATPSTPRTSSTPLPRRRSRSGHPGRAYLRSGAQPLVAFQTARVGGRGAATRWRRGHRPASSHWETLGDPPPREPARSPSAGPTDLAAVVAATTEAARHLDIARTASPWLPPLPDLVVADTLEAPAWHVPYALADLPRQQVQRPVTWDLEHGGHLAVAGASRTGRTSFLRTLGGTLAARFSPADVHLYGFDGSAGALQALARLPHTGAVVHRDDPARCDRLVSRLLEEIRRRQLLLAQQGFGSVEEQRRAASAPRRHDRRRTTGGSPAALPGAPARQLAGARDLLGVRRPRPSRRGPAAGAARGTRRRRPGRPHRRPQRAAVPGGLGGGRPAGPADDRRDGPPDGRHQRRRGAVAPACRAGRARRRLGGDAAGPPRRRHRRTRAERGPGGHRPDRSEAGRRGRARAAEGVAPVPGRGPADRDQRGRSCAAPPRQRHPSRRHPVRPGRLPPGAGG